MDSRIARMPAVADGDLMLAAGVAWQADMSEARVPYDAAYLAKCAAYEDTEIARAVNAGRCALLARHLEPGVSVLDIGAGTGAFVKAARASGFDAKGFDVILETMQSLSAAGLAGDPADVFDAVTLWDSIEHMEDPATALVGIRQGEKAFASLPIFADLWSVRDSKHYRPGEHLYYWTAHGFVSWMAHLGFKLLEQSNHEVAAGRHGIGAFAFERVRLATADCACGGPTYVDSFDWPRRARQWFLRCERCDGMSAAVATAEAAQGLRIEKSTEVAA